MRGLVLVALLIACGDDDSGSGRGGTHDASPVPDADGVCSPSGLCESGPQCGAFCCQPGERCADGTCVCGDDPACESGDYCTSGGPAQPTHGCGLFCCGPVSGVGCPI